MVKNLEPWLVVVCTICVLYLVKQHVTLYVSGFGNPYPSTSGIQLGSQVVDGANQVASSPGSMVYGTSAGGYSGFRGHKSAFMSEPPVFYPGIGDVMDASGSFTDMAGHDANAEMLNAEHNAGLTGAEGFKRNSGRDGFKRNSERSGFAATNLLAALKGQ